MIVYTQMERRKDKDKQKQRKESDLPSAVMQMNKYVHCMLYMHIHCTYVCMVYRKFVHVQKFGGKKFSDVSVRPKIKNTENFKQGKKTTKKYMKELQSESCIQGHHIRIQRSMGSSYWRGGVM